MKKATINSLFRSLRTAYAHGNYNGIQNCVDDIGLMAASEGMTEIVQLTERIFRKIEDGNLDIHREYDKLFDRSAGLMLKIDTEMHFLN